MAYFTYDIHGNTISNHDLQDKGVWCETGASKEETFVKKYGDELGLIINPEKTENPYAPDLLNTQNGLLADLKTQNTPFFQAESRFGYDPQFTVVFNGKDRDRYNELYPDIEIYFAVDWQAVKFVSNGKSIEVEPMVGVWKISFTELEEILKTAPFHSYQQRYDDQRGNAKGSYVLDLQNENFIRVI